MTPEQRDFLDLRTKPAIGGMLEAAYITGLHLDGVIYLEKVGHLKALANPPKGAQRYFSTSYLLKLSQDEKWLAKAIKLIRDNSRQRNLARKQTSTMGRREICELDTLRRKMGSEELPSTIHGGKRPASAGL